MRDDLRSPAGWAVPALAGSVLGSAAQVQQPHLWAWTWYGALCAAAFLLLVAAARAGGLLRRGAILLAAAALAFGLCGARSLQFASGALAPDLEGRDITVTGVVAAMPQRNESGLRFRLDVESAQAQGHPVGLVAQILLGWYAGAAPTGLGTFELQRQVPDLRAGDRWQMVVRLKAPHGNSNPHGFDYELWLWEQGVQATGYVRAGTSDPAPQLLSRTLSHPIELARQSVRDAVFEYVTDRKAAGLLAALIAGDQNAIERADWDVFRATGVAHLMSISGLHITMFAWAAALLAGMLWRLGARLCLAWPAQHAALVAGVVLASAYALFSGWGVPAQRTILMLATVGLLRLSGRRWPWPHVWLLACAVVVIADPWALMQPGFWLSFVAVGVLFASGAGTSPAGAGDDASRSARVLSAIGSPLREQWVVTLALTPLSLLLFGQVSVVGLLANAFAIPWVTLLVTPLAMGGVVWHPLWLAAAWAIEALQAYLQWLAALPFATVSMPAAPFWAGAAGVLGGLLLAMRLPWPVRALGVPLILPVLLWQAPRPASGEFEMIAADVGQGNALIVRTQAHTLVYDSGPRYSPESDAGHRVLVPLLRALGERVDTLVLSHRDSDHTGGALAVLAMQPQASLLSSIEDGHELQAVRPARRCVAGQQWRWDGVEFEVLHPQAGDYDAAARPNAMSCVLRISNGRQTALLAGDIELAQESRLVAQGARLRADVLLVPHHGSKTSSSSAFLDAVQPKLALVQAGYRNRFGHPAQPVLERYKERDVLVIASPRCGAALWASDRPLHVNCQREREPRYWNHRFP